ncbi:hypothetical protein [Tautonia sociabilis]|uniref:Uncharacterized protein n=1 Tax=Tautonia sociabilis TaxID=2080755 RepID=A0A432MEH9_9BACT|nr:hypothetical protein [Tautonia sociabilis]RUL83889.1 hypothetical protein TsocGM_21425 [Tautonia sociabilis]
MRRSKSMRPQVEGLESLVFLSTGMDPSVADRIAALRQRAAERMAPASATMKETHPDLSGTMRGNYTLLLASDGSSGTFQLQGIGSIRGLGPARISASYAADQSSAPETMAMTLTGRRGALNLVVGRAEGDTDPDSSTARLRYQVVSGTGAYEEAQGSGVLDMTLKPRLRTMGATGQLSITLRPEAA